MGTTWSAKSSRPPGSTGSAPSSELRKVAGRQGIAARRGLRGTGGTAVRTRGRSHAQQVDVTARDESEPTCHGPTLSAGRAVVNSYKETRDWSECRHWALVFDEDRMRRERAAAARPGLRPA